MSNNLLSSHSVECNLSFDAPSIAIQRARQILQHNPNGSGEYIASDQEVSRILARISELANNYLRVPNEIISAASPLGKPPKSEHQWER